MWPNAFWLENDAPETALPPQQQPPAKTCAGNRSGPQQFLGRLRRALRAERQRGIAGHWTYDLSRHAQLRDALDCEEALAFRSAAQTTCVVTCDTAEGSMPAECRAHDARLRQVRDA
ncbi:MAG: hypothetical protein CTY20_13140 [Hyphomicrobium sp.]|nr:MAG: hypothetical protein CTY20_13140 [Hyphomicrobium sp.]